MRDGGGCNAFDLQSSPSSPSQGGPPCYHAHPTKVGASKTITAKVKSELPNTPSCFLLIKNFEHIRSSLSYGVTFHFKYSNVV